MTESWFAVRELGHGVHLIGEPPHVNAYLVQGTDRAALIDTGLGIGNIRSAVESVTDQEIVVVNTHYHFDHSMGNHLFPRIAIHERGAQTLQEQVPQELLQLYMEFSRDLLENLDEYRELDARFFHFLTEETIPRSFPDDFDPEQWTHVPTSATEVLTEGDEVDLGNRTLRVLHTPGHTPDSICLLDEEYGILFGGDTINTGPIYAQFHDSDVAEFSASTRRLAEFSSEVQVVYVAHFLRYATDSAILSEIADGFGAVVEEKVNWDETRDMLGTVVREAKFARFSILVSHEEPPS